MNMYSLLWAISMVSVTVARPSLDDFKNCLKDNNNWDELRNIYRDIPRLKTFDFVITQHSHSFCPSDTNLGSIIAINLDSPGCRSGDLTLVMNDRQISVTAPIRFSVLMTQYPCFKNGDTVVFAAKMSVDNLNPVLFPSAVTIDLAGNTDAVAYSSLNFNHDTPMDQLPPNSFFWQQSASLVERQVKTIDDCNLPAQYESFKSVDGAYSFFQHSYKSDNVYGIQLHLVPEKPGCSFTGPLTIYGDFNPNHGFSFPDDCSGYVYVQQVERNTDEWVYGKLQCGTVFPYKFYTNPAAGASALLSSPAVPSQHVTDYQECGNVPIPDSPVISASAIKVQRTTPGDLQNTDIDHILLVNQDAPECVYAWNASFDDGDEYSLIIDDILKVKPCFKDARAVIMQVKYKYKCSFQNSGTVQVNFNLNAKDYNMLSIEFTGTELRKNLNPVFSQMNRCRSNTLDANIPTHNVYQIAVRRNATLNVRDTTISAIRFIKDQNCQPIWKLTQGAAGTNEILKYREFIEGSCLSFDDVVTMQYQYADICTDSWFWVQGKLRLKDQKSYPFRQGANLIFPGNKPETHLDNYVEISSQVTVPESVKPEIFIQNTNLPEIAVSHLSFDFDSTWETTMGSNNVWAMLFLMDDRATKYAAYPDMFSDNQFDFSSMFNKSRYPEADIREGRHVYLQFELVSGYDNLAVAPMGMKMSRVSRNGLRFKTTPNQTMGSFFTLETELYDRCDVQPSHQDITKHEAEAITIKREADNIYDSQISEIHFVRDAKCQATWNITNGEARSSSTITMQELFKTSKCLRAGDTVTMQYRYKNICPTTSYSLPVSVTLIDGNLLTIHAAGKRIEDHLLPTFESGMLPSPTPAPQPQTFTCDYYGHMKTVTNFQDLKYQLKDVMHIPGLFENTNVNMRGLKYPQTPSQTAFKGTIWNLDVEGCTHDVKLATSDFLGSLDTVSFFQAYPELKKADSCFQEGNSIAYSVSFQDPETREFCGPFLVPSVTILDFSSSTNQFKYIMHSFSPKKDMLPGDFLWEVGSSAYSNPSYCFEPPSMKNNRTVIEKQVSHIEFAPESFENVYGMEVFFYPAEGNGAKCSLEAKTLIFGTHSMAFEIPEKCEGQVYVLPLRIIKSSTYCTTTSNNVPDQTVYKTIFTVSGATSNKAFIDANGVSITSSLR